MGVDRGSSGKAARRRRLRAAFTALALLIAAAVPAMGWGVEFIGSRTGIPFGRYHYTDRLQPQVGRVPVLIPLAWLMMLPAAWAIADVITQEHNLAFSVVSGAAFTTWDLFLDPQMVGWGLWKWQKPGGYFGIPWTNYLGWMLASTVMTAIIQPVDLPVQALGLIYGLTWLLETVGLGILWKQPGPAFCGFLGMGGMVLWAYLASRTV